MMNPNNQYGFGRILLTILFAMCLRILPLPEMFKVYNPDWVLLALLYWSMALPQSVGIFHAFFFGLLTDVLTGRLLGQYALAYSIIIYINLLLYKRVRQFPLTQQALYIFFCLLLAQILLFFIKNAHQSEALRPTIWLPVLVGTLSWPLVYTVLRFVRLAKPLDN